ncbi:MAG: FAD-binding oxidoreductase [Alphaproteobacteria bacterium]|jgi:alkyldihydroxyacetonephosphate synthase|nr:FAD-binding oxidoreductase [Alphaproteobacteria bacterium]
MTITARENWSRRRKFYAWGAEDEGATDEEARAIERVWGEALGADGFEVTPPPTLDEINLKPSRVDRVPTSLQPICHTDTYQRALHTYGKTFMECARCFARDFADAPDAVVYPRDEAEVAAVLDWCGGAELAAIPFGGGSSAVYGVNPVVGERFKGVVTIDMSHMNRVLETDITSRAARVQAGVFGPDLDAQLKPHGLSLRFFMQAYPYSSLGGWIATRAAGHYAMGTTHIDDFVESVHMVTPKGGWRSRRLPASGAGPSPDRFAIGSEGAMGIITEAWLRLPSRPAHRRGATFAFAAFDDGIEALREVAQAGLNPANCRLIDPREAGLTGSYDGTKAILVLGFESAHHPVDAWIDIAMQACRDHGGEAVEETLAASGDTSATAAARWRQAFLREPFYREVKTARGIGRDTCETAIPWSGFRDLHEAVKTRTSRAIREVTGRDGTVTCRITHVYPDGPAPYFTFHFLCDKTRMVEQATAIKTAAYDAMTETGGTITHHHAVGRLHMPWYLKQRPPLFGEVLRAAKETLDPRGMMNPGVIVES